MMGRLDSLADPMKATPTDKQPGGGRSVEALAPIDADLVDAIRDVSPTLVAWGAFTGHRTIDEAFDDIANDLEDITRFWEGWMGRVLVVDGIRDFWTVADAMANWGPERRTKNDPEWVDDVSWEEVTAIPEWGDQLLNRGESALIAGSLRTLQRWQRSGAIQPTATIYLGGVRTVLFRRSDLLEAQRRVRSRVARERG